MSFQLARKIKERADETVDLTLFNVSALSVMKLVEESLEIAFQHRRGVVYLTTSEVALTSSMVLPLYDLREILYVPPDFPASEQLGIRPGSPIVETEEIEKREGISPDFVVDLVRSNTGGAKVWDEDGASIIPEGGSFSCSMHLTFSSRCGTFLR